MTVSNASLARPDDMARGITLILVAVLMMSVQEALFKYYSDSLSLWQIFTLRGLLALPLLVGIAAAKDQQRAMWTCAFQTWPLVRSLLLVLMFLAMYSSIPFLSLSVVAAGIYTGPLFVTLLSAYAIDEPVSSRGWMAVALGFAGVLVILQPGSDAFTLWTLLPVLCGLLYALSNLVTRGKCQGVPLLGLALSLNMAVLLTGAALSVAIFLWQPSANLVSEYSYLFVGWMSVGPAEWTTLIFLAVLVVAIAMSLAEAYRSAPPAKIATFDYAYLIFAAAWDNLIFDSAPSMTSMLGMALIIIAGLMVVRR